MNEEQRAIVKDNIKLLYSFMSKRGFYKSSEDWFGICAIGLCKAAQTYNESFGTTFSTYAYKCMETEVLAYRRRYAMKYIPTVSMSSCISDSEELTYGGVLSEEEHGFDNIICDDIKKGIEEAYSMLKPKAAEICKMVFENHMSQQEVANKYDVTRQYVNQVYRRFLNIVRVKLIKNKVVSPTGERLL